MNRYSRPVKILAPSALHPYELRFIDNGQKKIIQADSLDTLKREYTLDFLRSEDVAVVDMRGDKPKPVLF